MLLAALTFQDPQAAYFADAYFEAVRDFGALGGFGGFGWSQDRQGSLATVKAGCNKYLPIFESILQGKRFLTGADACYTDFQLLYLLDFTEELLPGELNAYPSLKRLRMELRELPNMQAFYKGPHRKLRVDERPAYMKEVNDAMGPR